MFVGEYTHNLDPKGRLAIPYRIRRELEQGAVVTRGIDGCLTLYTKDEWDKLASRIAALPLTDGRARRFARFFLAGAAEVEFDKQGRILVPGYLREFAGFSGAVVVAGMYNRVELWAADKWTEQATEKINESELTELGI
jgi:MraZ protein